MVAFPIIFMCYISILFHGKLKDKIIYLLFICTIYFGCDFLFAILLNIPSYITHTSSYTDLSSIPWQLFTLLLLKYLVCNILKQFSNKSRRHVDNKIFLYYLCIPISSLCIMLVTYYSGIGFDNNIKTKIMLCIYFAVMQIGNILIFSAFQKYSDELYNNVQQRLIITDQNLKLDYYNQVQILDNKQKAFIHNTSHYLKTIGSLISENKSNEALNILNELNIELETTATFLYSNNSVLNSILSEKKAFADKQNILFDIYIEPGTNIDGISDLDIITMLSNLIDNAIEASSKCKSNPFVRIRMYTQNQGNILVIKISNSYNGKPTKIGDTFKSTKKQSGIHGVGIKSVSSTAEKNGGYLEYIVEDSEVVSILLLPLDNQ